MNDSKRKSPRVPIDLVVQVEADGVVSPALAVNVGMGGMFLAGPELSYGQFVDVVAELPEFGSLRLPAVVRWTNGRGFGLQFLQLGAQATHALSKLVGSYAA